MTCVRMETNMIVLTKRCNIQLKGKQPGHSETKAQFSYPLSKWVQVGVCAISAGKEFRSIMVAE